MSDLTRAQVEQLLNGLVQDKVSGVQVAQLMDYFAALRAKLETLEQRQAWLDEVGPPQHPDDERHWVSAYLDAKQQFAAAQARVRELEGQVSGRKVTDEATSWNVLSLKERTDPEYIQGYIEGMGDTIAIEMDRIKCLTARLAQVEEALSSMHGIIPHQHCQSCNSFVLSISKALHPAQEGT